MSATQHDARAHQRRSRSCQGESLPLLPLPTQLPATSAGIERQDLHPVARSAMSEVDQQSQISRKPCDPLVASKSAPAKVQGREGTILRSLTLLDVPRAPSVTRSDRFRDGTPCYKPDLAKNCERVPTAKRKPIHTIQDAFHHLKCTCAMHRYTSFAA